MADTSHLKICFLGFSKLYTLAKQVIDAFPPSDVSFLLMDCGLDTQDECVAEAVAAGCEVFIAGPGNAARFRNHYDYPLVVIRIDAIDYAMAIQAAMKQGYQRIAIVRHGYSPLIPLADIQQLLGIPIQELVYETFDELFPMVMQADCDAVISPAGGIKAAEAAGKAGFLVYSSTSGIRDACLRAAELARELWESRRNREITKAVMNNAQLGVIVTDVDGRIQFFNHTAQSYTGVPGSQARGRHIRELIPHLAVSPFLKGNQRKNDCYRLIDGAMMRCVQERILMKGETVGVLTTMHPGAHNRKQPRRKTNDFNAHIYHWSELTARSDSMKRLVSQGRALASHRQPTVICGEAGSGQEEIAYCIHGGSDRAEYPCITLDLATIAGQDAPHVLLGYERDGQTINGMLINANQGSVVLKHVSLAHPAALACLDQVLNERQILLPGMESALTLDLRIFTVVEGEELEQLPPVLRSQLAIQRLDMPPLRTRKEDIGGLFLKYLSQLADIPTRFSLTDQMDALLRQYSWPGNVWELRGVSMRYAIARSELLEKPSGKTKYRLLLQSIGEDAFFHDLLRQYPILSQRPVTDIPSFAEAVRITKDWMKFSNDLLAERLHMSRTTLWRILHHGDKGDRSLPR